MGAKPWSLHSWAFWAILSAVFAALTAILGKNRNSRPLFELQSLSSPYLLSYGLRASGVIHSSFRQKPGPFLPYLGWLLGASWVCDFRALQLGDASKVAPIDKFSLVFVALFAVVFLGDRPSIRDWSGIGLVASGVLLLIFKR
jgi:transporter family protein